MNGQTDRGERVIWVAGIPLALRYTVNSLSELEDRAGMPLDRLIEWQFSATRLLLWAGLRQTRPALSVWDAGELIGEHLQKGGRLEDIVAGCADALRAAGLIGDAEDSGLDGDARRD